MRDEDEETLDPRSALQLLEAEASRTRRALGWGLWVQYAVWGVAWLIGLGGVALSTPREPPAAGPSVLSELVLGGLLTVALLVTGVRTFRATWGISGETRRRGRRLGIAWGMGYGALGAVVVSIARAGASAELVTLVAGAGALLVAGLLHVASGAAYDDGRMVALGGWVLLCAALGPLLGAALLPGVGALSGVGFLVAAAVELRRERGQA